MCCSTTRLKMNILYKWSKWKAPFRSEKNGLCHKEQTTREVGGGGGGVGHFADQCAGFFKPFGVQEFFFALHEPLQVHLLCLNFVLFFTYHPPPPPLLHFSGGASLVVLRPKYPQGLTARKTNMAVKTRWITERLSSERLSSVDLWFRRQYRSS